ncbi:MAG: hypothetical protein ACXU82_07855 [Caulobacteraceae bacterium]
MAKFMAIYTGTPGSQMPDEATIGKGMAAWQAWMQKHAAQIVEAGGPLGKTKRVTKAGVADSRNNIAAYVVVEAPDQDAAAAMFENHPHFAIFPGDGVDVMPCLPIPGQG